MNPCRGLATALVVGALLVPASGFAQTNRDTRSTKEAEKFIGLAMMSADPAAQQGRYREALAALQEAFTAEADNAKVWYIAGQAYAGLHDFAKADEAFDKAVALHPEAEADIEGEREAAWLTGFEAGVALMDAQNYDSALVVLEASHAVYPHRPEGLLNIGSIYANRGETDEAVRVFREAVTAARGPHLEKLDEEGKAQWERFAQMAELNIAQMTGAKGVELFEAEDYAAAAAAFEEAAEVNPYSRDYLFNIVQANYAQAANMQEQRDSAAAPGTAPEDQQLIQLYAGLRTQIAKVREFDPNNENLLAILAQSERRHGELTGNAEAGQQAALAVLQQLESMPVEVQNLIVTPGETDATIEGVIKNRTLAAGAPVTLNITLLGPDGASIGEATAQVTAPEAEATVPFTASAPVTGQIAGWKYTVAN
jgi:tetratricopeptide (TPR) repeat protein